jgi:hypothetical protein
MSTPTSLWLERVVPAGPPIFRAAEAMAKPGQELFYLSSEDYQKFATQQIDEARRFIAELGLKQD